MLLDTDVYSYLLRAGDKRSELYRPHVLNKTIAISFVTLGELYFGAAKRGWAKQRIALLEERLQWAVIIPYDVEVCRSYASLKAQISRLGRTASDNDLWIAACAVRNDLPLVSHNRRHFQAIPGLTPISEAPNN